MKTIPILLPILLACGCASGQRRGWVREPGLEAELAAMSKTDQEVRGEYMAAGIERPNPAISSRMTQVDSANTARIKDIIDKYGWPGRSLVGDDGETAAFLLVQHADSDPAFQERALALLQTAYYNKEAPGEHLALLTDRVLVAKGQLQLYGSQTQVVDRKIVVQPVEDPANLDKRRVQMGLPPMREYLKHLRRMFGLPTQQD